MDALVLVPLELYEKPGSVDVFSGPWLNQGQVLSEIGASSLLGLLVSRLVLLDRAFYLQHSTYFNYDPYPYPLPEGPRPVAGSVFPPFAAVPSPLGTIITSRPTQDILSSGSPKAARLIESCAPSGGAL